MRRNFLRSLIICLVPTLIAAFFVGLGFWKESTGEVGFRRGIDLAGGTILIYEVDRDKLKGAEELQPEEIKQLADKLKKRIDENDLYNVVVRPLGRNRIEIILPFASSTTGTGKANDSEFIESVRQKVRQTGVLEFRIVANPVDDADGLRAAEEQINNPSEEMKKSLLARAEKGLPPLGPILGNNEELAKPFSVKAAGDNEVEVVYEWVELGKEEREAFGLSQAYSKEAPPLRYGKPRGWSFPILEKSRDPDVTKCKAMPFQNGLVYSRPFKKRPDLQTAEDKGVDAAGKAIGSPKEVEYFLLTRVSDVDRLQVSGDVRVSAHSQPQGGKPGVSFTFNPAGARAFSDMTTRNKPAGNEGKFTRQLAILMDGRIVSAPSLNAILSDNGSITGDSFDQPAVNQLVSILRSGNLNAELKPDPVSENTIGATLGETTIKNGLFAVGGSFIAVLIFMVVYYRFSGLVACVALFINLLMTVGFMVAMHAAFTLPGMAGIVLMLGMAVDANVLIYERLREEREKGATIAGALRNGYDRALPTIIDTHLTSIFTAIVMYTFGNDALKGFSVAVVVGLIISLFTSLFITRLLFDFWLQKKWLTQLKMMKMFARPTFDFMKIRNAMFGITIALTVIGLFLFLARGEKVLNVDFTQGTVYGGRLTDGKSLSEMLNLLSEDNQKKKLKVKDVSANPQAAGFIYDVTYEDGSKASVALGGKPDGANETEQLANLKARFGALPDVSVEQVFLSGDTASLGGGKSYSFTVRTTEREKEIVQVILDKLLRSESGDPLMKTVKTLPLAATGLTVNASFDQRVSPTYFKDFVLRELKLRDLIRDENTDLTAVGVASADPAKSEVEGRELKYETVKLDFTKIEVFKALRSMQDSTAEQKASATTLLNTVLTKAKEAFESRPVPERLETFDPALAKDTRSKALMAILLSWIAVLGYLWFRFGSWQFGLAAVLCLIHDLCFTLGAIAVCHYLHDTWFGHWLGLKDFKIDLTAIAALLTLVGYSVNDTIVVFDRIREVRGKSPVLTTQMINDSVNGTLSRTVLAALTVFLVVVVLYMFGGEGVHLFAFVMVMGVIVGTYSSIYIASPLLLIFGEGKPKITSGPGSASPDDKPIEAPVSAMAS